MVEQQVAALAESLTLWRLKYVYPHRSNTRARARATLERHADAMAGLRSQLLAKYGRAQ